MKNFKEAQWRLGVIAIFGYHSPEIDLYRAIVSENYDFNLPSKEECYLIYDKYATTKRTDMLKEYGITPSKDFVSKIVRDETKASLKRNTPATNTYIDPNQPATENKNCICTFCSGIGTMRIKSIEVYYPDVVKDGRVVGRSSTSQTRTIYEDLTCTRCLGTGKCK